MHSIWKAFSDSSSFMPHGHCYFWDRGLVGLHLASDSLIGLAYVAISLTLGYLVYRARRDIPFHWVFLAFGGFIIACGGTHFMEVWTLWVPLYWLSGSVKAVTALASIATAVVLPPLLPKVFALLDSARLSENRKRSLENAHAELQALYEKNKELDQLKTQFFANVSHELRTPLALILGPAGKLLASASLAPEQRRDLEVVDRNARTLLKHVNDLLDIAKLEVGKVGLRYAGADLAQLTRRTASHFEVLSRERSVSFSIEAPPSLPAQIDADKIERVLLNVLSNAFKFAGEGGRVRCSLHAESGHAILSVADNGPGISPALRQVVFERFRQGDEGAARRFGGTGLGLAIAKEFVELHRGWITVGDPPGGGALVTISVPLAAPAEANVARQDGDSPATAETVRQTIEELTAPPETTPPPVEHPSDAPLVLVVEDNPAMNRFIVDTLAPAYRTASASNGREGLEKALALRPDLILTDIMMPEATGVQLVEDVRACPELEALPVMVLTAKADDNLRVELLRDRVQDYLTKPFAAAELLARAGNLVIMKRAAEILQRQLASSTHSLDALASEAVGRQRQLELAKAQAEEANRAKDDFLATVSHELRTPLTAILGWSRLLRSASMDEAETHTALETIERNARHQTKLINDLLDVSRIVSGRLQLKVECLHLPAVIDAAIDTARPAAQAKNITLECSLDRSVLPVSGDPDRLQQVVWNLLSNAIKFTPQGGRVAVTLQKTGDRARVVVSDTGMGIDPDFLPHVFDRFRQADSALTRRHSGLGIGLAIVRHLVELHGGVIRGESAGERKGAAFTFELPLISPPSPAFQPVPGESLANSYAPSLRGIRVLIVDDDPDALSYFRSVLVRLEAEVLTTGSAGESLSRLAEFEPHVLVSDLAMPDQDGLDLVRKVKDWAAARSRRLPALAVSACAREEDRERALEAGFEMHLAKPVEPQELAAAVALLSGRQ